LFVNHASRQVDASDGVAPVARLDDVADIQDGRNVSVVPDAKTLTWVTSRTLHLWFYITSVIEHSA
jgi:hypothetical protein